MTINPWLTLRKNTFIRGRSGDDSKPPPYHRGVIVTQHLLIKGSVQGVGFRFFTKSEAQKHKISGWVRNLKDGRVEALVQGMRDDLERFLVIVRRGPIRAKVEELVIQRIDLEKSLVDFLIIENSEQIWSEK